ncbi:response regulator [Parabacteroides sp. AM08-6]|uniref:response regulator n=1 Tax=Parabacteroides sp. AM08-6 TaxID=2292053 RepID=UPI000EFE4124|nr:response regulator [Parabacteroides sp. AM08-6]RHJ80010.1 response regulator [Parabacteroides sp. AM08-6]
MGTNEENKNVTILIAEDEESNFLLLKTILKKHCNVIQAKTGVELLKVYNEQHADLILLDIKMPEMNGLEALKEIRKKDKEIPIIMQSAYAFENDMEAARAAGSNGFITKPINIVELKKTISTYLPQIVW